MKKTVKNLITWSPSHLITSQKSAFTLAEVLITLAIIGVVAAMTIPTLTANYKKKVVETKLSKFYSTINQALKLSSVYNGPYETWDKFKTEEVLDEDGNVLWNRSVNTLEWFNKYLAPYLRTLDVVADSNDRDGKIAVYLPDGSLLYFESSSWLFYPDAKDFKTTLQDDGFNNRDKSLSGTKYFTFLFTAPSNVTVNDNTVGIGVQPYVNTQWNGTMDDLYNDPRLGCNEAVTNERAFCTKLIQMNNWKIPKDYPLSF